MIPSGLLCVLCVLGGETSVARSILLELSKAAEENAGRPERVEEKEEKQGKEKWEEKLSGDALTDHLVRAAARAARRELERGAGGKESARGLFLALGVGLDSSGFLREHPLARLLIGEIESGEEASRRRSAVRAATLRGRVDALRHFAVAAALAAALGEAPAWAACLEKESSDALGKDRGEGTGFSFADLAAGQAGIALARRVLAGAESDGRLPAILDGLAAGFRGADHLPDRSEGECDEGLGWKEFQARFGSLGDPRFQARIRALREEVLRSPGFRELR